MELKELRKGFTTGTCAQAAAKAAVMMLTSGKIVETVDIVTASGAKLNINLSDQGKRRWICLLLRNQRFRG